MHTSIRAILLLLAATATTALASCTDFSIVEPGATGGSGGSQSTSTATRTVTGGSGGSQSTSTATETATGGSGTPECAPGSHLCAEACLDDQSPASCGAACTPCVPPPNATSTCDGATCGFACAPGFADCDGDAANGCEADLSSAATCGSCATACAAPTPFCKGDVCASDCGAPPVVACGLSCVDITADPLHCGGCATPCPTDPNGTATCNNGICGITCAAGHHDCGGVCVSDASVATCGAACSPCPTPANGTATCNGVGCGFACSAGYADCDGIAANGCEADLSSAASCGSCGTICSGATPVCDNVGGGHFCASGCGGAAPTLCGASCVDATSDPGNCGACFNVCPGAVNGTATCTGGTCGHVCNAGYHDCGGVCVSNGSVSSCGTSCVPCAAPANAAATCDGSSCGHTCNAGFLACGGVCSSSIGADCMTGQLGACAAGKIACSGGSLVCTQNQAPAAEICDSVDNNCNGQVDEGNPGGGVACNPNGNVCQNGTTSCSAGAPVCNLTSNVGLGAGCAPGKVCDGDGSCCDSTVKAAGQTLVFQSDPGGQYVFAGLWCSIPLNTPPQCVQGNFTSAQYLENAFCTAVGSNGSCTDPDAAWFVTCSAWVACVYDCNGVCVPTGAGC